MDSIRQAKVKPTLETNKQTFITLWKNISGLAVFDGNTALCCMSVRAFSSFAVDPFKYLAHFVLPLSPIAFISHTASTFIVVILALERYFAVCRSKVMSFKVKKI